MADVVDDHERHCHDLLVKLKKTTESLLANQSALGPWGTYGALRRICDDAEAILCHRLKKIEYSQSVGGYWEFVQGLKWLSPNIAPVIEKINELKQCQNLDSIDDGRDWLNESVQDHSLMAQLDILTSDMDYLCSYYYDDAFLRQPMYRDAMRICFKAIELNKPALLAEISLHLLKSAHVESQSLLYKSQTDLRSHRTAPLLRSQSDWRVHAATMGNKNSHLNVHYSTHLSSSNMSLSVDPSLGGSSLLQQKILSGPCYVSSLDSPGLLENLGSDPLSEGMRSMQRSITTHHISQPGDQAHRSFYHSGPASLRHHSAGVQPLRLSKIDGNVSICDRNTTANGSIKDHSHKTAQTKVTAQCSEERPRSESLSSFEDISHEADCLLREKSDSLRVDDLTPDSRNSIVSLVLLDSSYLDTSDHYTTSNHIDIRAQSLSKINTVSPGSSLGPGNISQLSESYDSQQGSSVKLGSHVSLGVDASLALSSASLEGCTCSRGDSSDSHQDTVDSGQHLCNGCKTQKWSSSDLHSRGRDSFSRIDKRYYLVQSDPHLNVETAVVENRKDTQAWIREKCTSPQPWSEPDLYNLISPGTSPVIKNSTSSMLKSSGSVYIPQVMVTSALAVSRSPPVTNTSNNSTASRAKPIQAPPSVTANSRPGHKRWVSDTSTIQVVSDPPVEPAPQSSSVSSSAVGKTSKKMLQSTGQKASGWESESYQSAMTKPTEGQSLMSYLTSQDFNTCANLEKENAHFHISEALIAAFESMKWNRMMKKQASGRSSSTSSSSSSSDEEINALRQRIRIRKREKFLEKGRPFPSMSDGQTDTVTTSQSVSSPAESSQDVSSMSEDSNEEDDGQDIDVSMSTDGHTNLAQLRSSGLTLSMASLYSDAELARRNKHIVKIKTLEESLNPGSAESIAISLLKRFSEKHLPKASELQWLVTEVDCPQPLLPLPPSIPISPDDADNGDVATPNKTRLRGNMEWAPPRQQIIFSIHAPEKRETVMCRQNFRCAGCGTKVDPAFVKRYRYCEYLGKYFCQCCHTSQTSIIPGHVLERWHFGRFPVSTFSFTLLERIWPEPLFHLDTINPVLYKKVRVLETIRESRQQLVHLQSLLTVCKRDLRVMKEMQDLPSHWLTNDDSYSMADFTEVKTGTMLQRIRSFINLAINHVTDCQLCQGLGFLCGMCLDSKVIFPYQLDTVVTCQVCQSCYHKDCFVPEKCPKCIRMEARRRALQEPMTPESPDSGNEDSTSSDKTIILAGSPMSGSADECR